MAIPCTKWTKGASSLLRTLSSVVNETSPNAQLESVVVVVLLDNDRSYNDEVTERILHQFLRYVSVGFIHIYEPGPVHANISNADVRTIRVMADYAKSSYYLHLADDVECAPSFYHQIIHFITSKGLKGASSWSLVEFSEMDLVGKLLRTSDLHKFSTFLTLFSSELISPEHILALFRHTMLQPKQIMLRPTLFQRQDATPLHKHDRYFARAEPVGDNPEGRVVTNMDAVGQNKPEFAYPGGQSMFWAKSARAGDFLTIVFDAEIALDKVHVRTGFVDADFEEGDSGTYALHNASIEASPKLLKMDAANLQVSCADYRVIGRAQSSSVKLENVPEKLHRRKTKCLTIRITQDHPEGIMFQSISVFTKNR